MKLEKKPFTALSSLVQKPQTLPVLIPSDKFPVSSIDFPSGPVNE
jgi:hypothetical protein